MRRYPPSTINRYLDLPSTQRIQTHTLHRHNTTPPLPTLVQAPTHSPPTPPRPKHRHVSNTPPVPTGLVKPNPNPLIHSSPSPPTPPRAIHISHIPPTPHPTHPHLTGQLRQTQCLNHVYHPHALHSPHLIYPPHQHYRQPRTITLSADTHETQSSQFRKPSSPLKQTHAKYITSPPRVPIGCTRQKVGSLHSLETILHSLQHTYLRPSIHTTQNFKWSRYTLTTLNISQLQTFIYLLETAHPRTTKQLIRTLQRHWRRAFFLT